jgi:O-antigen/teichoic acid export membrane protein
MAQSILTITGIPAFVGLAAIAPSLLCITIGKQWDPSILPTRILALVSLVHWLAFFFGHVITALGWPRMRLAIVTARSLTQLTAFSSVSATHCWVATGGAVTQIIFYGIELAILRRLVKFSLSAYLRVAWCPGLAAATMAVVVVYIEHFFVNAHSILLLAMEVALGGGVYGVVLLAFARLRGRQLVDLHGNFGGESLSRNYRSLEVP